MSHRIRRFIPFAIVAVVAGLGGASLARATPEAASPFRNLAVFARALAHVEMSYVEPIDQDELVYGAIRGMMRTLDPHTSFMDPEEYRILTSDTRGRFAGIGVEISVRDGWLTVLGVFEGGPASRADVQPGDRFLWVAGHEGRDMSIDQAVRLMRGEPGTEVRVRLRREGVADPIDLTLVRAIIEVRAVEARVLPDRVVYLEVKTFSANTTLELREALDVALEETRDAGGIRGVLIDMRNNAGGLLEQSILMSDEFLDDGLIVSTRARGGRLLHEAHAHRRGTRPDWPIAVLVNGYTASAAEIVAGALRDHGRAVIVGTRTFGKGSVQNIIELPDGSAMKLTIARYYTPSGRSIQAEGIEPDMMVEQLDAEVLAEARQGRTEIHEASLEGHLSSGQEPPERPSTTPERGQARTGVDGATEATPPFADDYQARMAHQALRAIIVTREVD